MHATFCECFVCEFWNCSCFGNVTRFVCDAVQIVFVSKTLHVYRNTEKEAGVLRNPAVSLEITFREHNTLVFHVLVAGDNGIR